MCGCGEVCCGFGVVLCGLVLPMPTRPCQVPPKACFTTDDMWISGYLAMAPHIDRVLIPRGKGLDPEPAPFQQEGKDKSGFQLSSFNSKNLQDIKCIDDLEARFGGSPWRTVVLAEEQAELQAELALQQREAAGGGGDSSARHVRGR